MQELQDFSIETLPYTSGMVICSISTKPKGNQKVQANLKISIPTWYIVLTPKSARIKNMIEITKLQIQPCNSGNITRIHNEFLKILPFSFMTWSHDASPWKI